MTLLAARRKIPRLLCALLWLCSSFNVAAETALVAVAANFAEALESLQAQFQGTHPHRVTVVVGSTGKLYAQIRQGAPFDILLAADQARPELLVRDGLAQPDSRYTYAVGCLTLWSADPERIATNGAQTLRAGSFRKLAIANPDLAPYGAAARETLAALGLLEDLRDRLVMGENIGQAHALVATGNAEVGLIALSYALSPRNALPGSRWDVPQGLYTPIRQDAVLLNRATNNAAARDFLAYLQSAAARALIQRFGYGVN